MKKGDVFYGILDTKYNCIDGLYYEKRSAESVRFFDAPSPDSIIVKIEILEDDKYQENPFSKAINHQKNSEEKQSKKTPRRRKQRVK